MTITIRDYHRSDTKYLADIFYNTIHTINAADYTKAQLNAWAPSSCLELTRWHQRWQEKPPYVALIEHSIAGFAELEPDGHIDCFYVHHLHQGKNVGSALMLHVEKSARALGLQKLFAEVSITAVPFFKAKSFHEVKSQLVKRNGQLLKNFIMEKHL